MSMLDRMRPNPHLDDAALAGILAVMNITTRSSADPLVHKQALAIADRLHLIDRGKLVASGTPEEMRAVREGLVARFFEASGIRSQSLSSATG